MKQITSNRTILNSLEGEQLSAITFVQDYLQLHFDGPYINAYIWPKVVVRQHSTGYHDPRYRDILCEQIAKIVKRVALLDEERLEIQFQDETLIVIPLREEDKATAEAAMFQDSNGETWNIW